MRIKALLTMMKNMAIGSILSFIKGELKRKPLGSLSSSRSSSVSSHIKALVR